MNIGNKGKQQQLVKLSEYYDAHRMKTLAQIRFHKDRNDTIINVTFYTRYNTHLKSTNIIKTDRQTNFYMVDACSGRPLANLP